MPQFTDEESLFARHFRGSSPLCSVDCACGRTHFVTAEGHGDYEPGELEELKAKAAEEPARYIECWEYDHIDTVTVINKEVVMDCPCGTGTAHALFLARHADQCAALLLELMTARADKSEKFQRHCRAQAAALAKKG